MDRDDSLKVALDRVSVLMVAEDMGYELKLGANKSPFREDKNPSFAVLHGGRSFLDYGVDQRPQGAWVFVTRAKPDWSKGDVAAYLKKLAGIDPEAGRGKWRPKSKTAVKQERSEKRRKLFQEAGKELDVRDLEATPVWPGEIKERYLEGCRWAEAPEAQSYFKKLAAERGWPVAWVRALAECGKIAWPLEPWKNGKRMVAFLVERPGGRMKVEG